MSDPRKPIVAIDGPAGAGKSTVAREVARRLGLPYIDTGAMYRAIAWLAIRCGIDLDDAKELAWLATYTNLEFAGPPDKPQIYVNGYMPGEELRSPEVSQGASKVSAVPGVRKALTRQQQQLGRQRGCVMEGRDIGTVVFPDAKVKVFLTASPEERVKRRREEMEAKGQPCNPEELHQQLLERDRRDAERDVAPMKPAPNAVLIDTDGLSIPQVVDRIVALARRTAP
ncbi:MAG: (d)CMP kinase [Armatimonadetes bacterium]|nr:(d)CMP kinase [Armatimonadota bacterium]